MRMMLAPELRSVDLGFFMRKALAEAEQAGIAGELPIGAVVVIDGKVVSRGRAAHQSRQSQLMHAELNALLTGDAPLWQDYRRAILFTTVEPCPMCLGAAVMADVPHIVFAAPDRVVLSAQTVRDNAYVHRHIRTYYGGVLEEEAREIIQRFDPKILDYISGHPKPSATRALRPQEPAARTHQEDVRIRKANPSDVGVLGLLNKRLIEDEQHPHPMTTEELTQRMAEWLQAEYTCHLAVAGDAILGYCLFKDDGEHYYLRQLYLEREHRRKGIATFMLDWMYCHVWTDKKVRLDVFSHNHDAIAFYQAYGFQTGCLRMQK